MTQPIPANVETIYQDIRQLIEAAKGQVVSQINQTLELTYWQIGKRIKTEVLQDERAQYGAGIIKQLAAQLTREYGSGFSHSSLTRMAKFYAYLPEQAIVATLSQQLRWSHFVELKRDFYIRLCSDARWPVRTLRERMDSMLYERTALSKQADSVIAQELATPSTPQIFLKDPYLLDFLDLKDNFTEKDLENAILGELERFILELGSDFAFMNRQKRIQIGGNDYYPPASE